MTTVGGGRSLRWHGPVTDALAPVKGMSLDISHLSPEQWEAEAKRWGVVHDVSGWILGDLVLVGLEQERGYDEMAAKLRRPRQSLYNLKSLSERYPPGERVEALTWAMHAEVRALPPEDRRRLLAEAVAMRQEPDGENLNVQGFLRESRQELTSRETQPVRLTLPADLVELIEKHFTREEGVAWYALNALWDHVGGALVAREKMREVPRNR